MVESATSVSACWCTYKGGHGHGLVSVTPSAGLLLRCCFTSTEPRFIKLGDGSILGRPRLDWLSHSSWTLTAGLPSSSPKTRAAAAAAVSPSPRGMVVVVVVVVVCVCVCVWGGGGVLKRPAGQTSRQTPSTGLRHHALPSTTAVFSYATGSRKLSANEKFFLLVLEQ